MGTQHATQASDRHIVVLRMIAPHRQGVSLNDLAAGVALAPGSIRELVNDLQDWGYAKWSDTRQRVTPTLMGQNRVSGTVYEYLPNIGEGLPLEFEVMTGSKLKVSGADGLFGIEWEIQLRCSHCQWTGPKEGATQHYEKHLQLQAEW